MEVKESEPKGLVGDKEDEEIVADVVKVEGDHGPF